MKETAIEKFLNNYDRDIKISKIEEKSFETCQFPKDLLKTLNLNYIKQDTAFKCVSYREAAIQIHQFNIIT